MFDLEEKTKNPWKMFTKYIEDKMYTVAGPVSEKHGNRFGSADEWVAYRQRTKTQCPLLAKINDITDEIDSFCYCWKRKLLEDPRSFLRNIFIHPMWMVRAKTLDIGQWVDSDTRILHINMEMLRFFIEEDNHNYLNEKGDFEPWEIKEHRKREAGEPSQFDGENGMTESQYEAMRDAWEIYQWWKDYPRRQKEIEGIYDEIPSCDEDEIMAHFTEERREKTRPYRDRIQELEKKLEEEEEKYLILLMKIRKCLWS